MPPRNVVPKPVQKPHPPLWVACSRRDTILLAAEKGIGALTFAFIDPEEARQLGRPTTTRRWPTKCVPVGKAVNPQRRLRDADDVRPRRGRGHRAGASRAPTSSATRWPTTTCSASTSPATTDVWEEFLERRDEMGYSPEAAIAARARDASAPRSPPATTTGLRGAVGTPDQIREFLRRYEEAGVDQLIFVMQAGKNRHEHIMESLELFGREVLPEFEERDDAQVGRAKADALRADHRGGDGPQGRRRPADARGLRR